MREAVVRERGQALNSRRRPAAVAMALAIHLPQRLRGTHRRAHTRTLTFRCRPPCSKGLTAARSCRQPQRPQQRQLHASHLERPYPRRAARRRSCCHPPLPTTRSPGQRHRPLPDQGTGAAGRSRTSPRRLQTCTRARCRGTNHMQSWPRPCGRHARPLQACLVALSVQTGQRTRQVTCRTAHHMFRSMRRAELAVQWPLALR